MTTAPSGQEDVHLWVEAPAVVVWGAIGLTGFFAAVFALAGLDRASPARALESAGLLALAVILGLLAFRIWRYYRRPQVSLEGEVLLHRPFLRPVSRWRLGDIAGLAVEVQKITHSSSKRLPVPVLVERLEIVTRNGRRQKFVLPKFPGGNETLLAALAARTGLPIEDKLSSTGADG